MLLGCWFWWFRYEHRLLLWGLLVSWEDPMVFDGRITWICWTGSVPGLVSRCEAWKKKFFVKMGKKILYGQLQGKNPFTAYLFFMKLAGELRTWLCKFCFWSLLWWIDCLKPFSLCTWEPEMFFLVLEDVRWFWQEGNVKNQREHLVLLLANAQMRLQPQATNRVGFVLPPNFSMQLGIVLEFKSSSAHLLQSGWNCHQIHPRLCVFQGLFLCSLWCH